MMMSCQTVNQVWSPDRIHADHGPFARSSCSVIGVIPCLQYKVQVLHKAVVDGEQSPDICGHGEDRALIGWFFTTSLAYL